VSDPQTTRAAPAQVALFAATVGTGAFLLFSVQLLVGKRLLPWFGGTSALWTTCQMFFQAALLAGYAWAHLLAERASARRQRDLHLLLLALALGLLAFAWPSPVTPGDGARPLPGDPPVATTLCLLASSIGLPFVVLAATSPLLSAWLVRLLPRASPFWLFALSNLGSLAGLVGYPLLLEPLASLRLQGWLWCAAFALFALGVVACALAAGRVPAARVVAKALPPPGAGLRWLWLGLSAFPSVMLLAVTSHLTQEVAAVPLLWMLPLALYLLSFVLCFGWPALAARSVLVPALALAAVAAAFALQRTLALGAGERILLWSAVLFVYGMAGHGELVRRRPAPAGLTGFYLTVAAGGALGGVLNALVAPRVFDGYWELQLGIFAGPALVALAWALDPASGLRDGRDRVVALRAAIATAATLVALLAWLVADVASSRAGLVLARRGFYGVLRVVRENAGGPDEQLKLLHGRIAHGLQLQDLERGREPTTYFGPSSGVGLAIRRHPRRLAGEPLRVGIVGLGVGTLAAWSRRGDVFRFYELDPEVGRLSLGTPPVFRYLSEAAGEVSVHLGDGRLSLEREPPQELDLLVLDAFSSDAIPVHLLTLEAFSEYERHLRPGGVIAVQVTNRYVDLKPVVRGAAARLGLTALHVPSFERGMLWSSDWMLVARDRALLEDEVIGAASLPPLDGSRPLVWTDDWSDLVRVLKR
jgi:SAM-dependent methyltransferase